MLPIRGNALWRMTRISSRTALRSQEAPWGRRREGQRIEAERLNPCPVLAPPPSETGTARVKRGMAEMLKGGVIMDVVTPEQAKIAEDAGAVAVMALERVPADIRVAGRRGPDERPRHDRRDHRAPCRSR